jgi:hypothetical protein
MGLMPRCYHSDRHANPNASSSIPPSNRSKVKSSVQRGLRQKLLETYPGFEPFIEDIMPKKASLEAVKLYDTNSTIFAPSILRLLSPLPTQSTCIL